MTIREGTFYPVWVKLDSKNLQHQWGEVRSNTSETKAIVRNSVQELEDGVNTLAALRALLGLEVGDLDFRNKWRIFYNKTTRDFTIQRNDGTVNVPDWVDIIQIRVDDGQFQVVSSGGVQSNAGFYGPGLGTIDEIAEYAGSTNTAGDSFKKPNELHFNTDHGFTLTPITTGPNKGKPLVNLDNPAGTARAFSRIGIEWKVEHNFNTSPVMVQTFDSRDEYMPVNHDRFYNCRRDTNDPILTKIDVSDPNITYFYFDRTVAGTAFIATGGLGNLFYGITVKQTGDERRFREINTMAFNSDRFYVTQNSPNTDEVVINFRDNVPHASLTGLGGDDHPQYIRTDGTRDFSGDQSMGDNKLTDLGAPTEGTDAARFQDISAGFYGINVKQTDDPAATVASFSDIKTVAFNTDRFYVTQNSPNTDEVVINFRDNVPHASLTGLGGDDHPQYLREDGQRAQSGTQVGEFKVANKVLAEAFYIRSGGELMASDVDSTLVNKNVAGNLIELDADTKNIVPDFSDANSYFVSLQKNCTFDPPSNMPGEGYSTTLQIITQQPPVGFYNISWASEYMFPRAQYAVGRRGPNATQTPASIDVFSFVSVEALKQGERMLGVAAFNFY
jgi:hypothetical protein